MPLIGDMDRRITVQRATVTENTFGEQKPSWADFTTVWAKRKDALDGEKIAAGQVGSKLMSRFVIRSSINARTITPQDRISYDGFFWEISGVKQVAKGRDRFIEITAVRDAD